MGLVINPTAFRIGHVKAWTDAWYVHRMHYPVFVHKSLEIRTLLQYVLWYFYPSRSSNWIYSHSTFYYTGNKFYISLFVYDGHNSYMYKRMGRNHRYGWYRRLQMKTYWKKRELLDLEYGFQRWLFLCQTFNFDFENLKLDDLRWRMPEREVHKIRGLRKKYGHNWTAREELAIWAFPISFTEEYGTHEHFGMKILNKVYKHFIYRRMKRSLFGLDFDNTDSAFTVLKSYRRFFFFFAYVEKILKYMPTYPKSVFKRLSYKLLYRSYYMFFVYKPYWKHLCKIYELVLQYINVNSKMKVYILDNRHLNAAYIARYITTCLRAKYDYRDTMIPIRKTLEKLLYARRWRSGDFIKKKGWETFIGRYKNILKDRMQFHLINQEFTRLSIFRWKLLKKLESWKRNLFYRRFRFVNFVNLRKTLVEIKEKTLEKNYLFKSYLVKKYYNKSKMVRYSAVFNILKFHYLFKKKRNVKHFFFFFKKKVIKKTLKEKYLMFRRKLNIAINLHYKYFRLLKIFHLRVRRLFMLKDLIFSLYFLSKLRLKKKFTIIKLSRLKIWKFRKVHVLYNFWKDWESDIRHRFMKRWNMANKRLWNYPKKADIRIYERWIKRTRRMLNWRRNRRRRGIEPTYTPTFVAYKRMGIKKDYLDSFRKRRKILHHYLYLSNIRTKVKKAVEKKIMYLDKIMKRNIKVFEQKNLKMRYALEEKIIFYKKILKNSSKIYKNRRIKIFSMPYRSYLKSNIDLVEIKKIKINFFQPNHIYLYDKGFFRKIFDVYKKKFLIRGYSNLIFFNYLNQYANRFKPFVFNVDVYKKYIQNLMNLDLTNVSSQFVKQYPKTKDLEETPLIDKFKRLRVVENGTRSILYGYKFHFVGRFTRKQKAASLWFSQGANSVSSMHVDVDYGFHTVTLRYSACTLKVWLYKNKGHSYKYGFRLV